jgi:DNA repair exonuclease SbcCD ATPase subunit
MIDLQKLTLDGWMSYDKETFKLNSPGITRIHGEVGSGKSAILEAIFYLLFGKTLRDKETIDNFVNKVLDSGYDIKLWFTLDGIPYAIREVRGRAKRGLYFYKHDKDLRGKSDPETRKIILNTLGMTSDDFRSIAFLGQRQTQFLVEGKPAERARAIVDIFALNKYDELITLCDMDLKLAIEEKKELATNFERYSQELENLENSLLDDDDDEDIDPGDLDKLENKISDIATKILKIRKLSEHVQNIITKATTLDAQRQRVRNLSIEIKKLKAERKKYNKPDSDLTETEDLLEDLQQEHAEATHTLKQAKKEIENAKAMTNTCPINSEDCPANIPLDNKESIITKFTKRAKKARKEEKTIDDEIKKAKKTKNLIKAYEAIETAIKNKKDAISELQDTELEKVNIKEEKKKLKKYKSGIEKGSEKLDELVNDRTELKAALAVSQEKKSTKEKINEALAEKEEAVSDLKEQVSNKSIEAQYLAGALAVFKKMKMYKIDLVLQLLNTHLKEILEKISNEEYKAEFISQRTGSDKKKKLDKIGILVYDSYKVLPIEVCSGGQATEVGLAVLLSTWKTANSISQKGVSSLWLDEVFGPLNEEIINRIFDSVVEIANDLGATSINIISHRDLDSRLFDYFWDLEREDGITNVKIY